MARATIPVVSTAQGGVPEGAAAAGTNQGAKFANDGKVFLRLQNTDAAVDYAITLEVPYTVGGLSISPFLITVPHGSAWYLAGPFPTQYFDEPSGTMDQGDVYVDFPAGHEAAINVLAIHLGQ